MQVKDSVILDQIKANKLAKCIQKAFPIDIYPFRVLANEINSSETQVINQIKHWKKTNLLREISAIMEGSILGYDSALVCGKVPSSKISDVAKIISTHPTVTHNYERNHKYNLWFTIAIPSYMSLHSHLEILQVLTNIDKYHPLRKTKVFKRGVICDLITKSNYTERVDLPDSFEGIDFSYKDIKIIRALQKDLPICQRPFKLLAENNYLKENDIIDFLKNHMAKAVRRYVATFRHRNVGIKANGMVLWNIKNNINEKGYILADSPEVSHCFARTTIPDFRYNIYSMIHGPNMDYLKDIANKLAYKIGCKDYIILNSIAEYKKTRLRYFLPELQTWWEKYKSLLYKNLLKEEAIR